MVSDDMESLADKVVLITGASSGIGAGCALEFAKHGSKLALSGRNSDNLHKTVEKVKEMGHPDSKIFTVLADLMKDEDVEKVMRETVAHYGQLDVLVNNAGTVHVGTVESLGMAGYDEQMHINARVYYFLTHIAIPHLKKTKGAIVNVSSVNGIRAFPGVSAYCMSKGAVDQLTRCSALELAPSGVRVNAVNPGVIITDIHKRGGMDEETYQKFLEHSKNTHALGRPGQVSEVSQTIAFLASDASSFITGATIPIDGGRHAMCPR